MEKYIGTYHKSSPFIQNLLKKQICSFEMSWQNPPRFADFSKSATGQLLTCACRNSTPGLQIFLKSATHCRFTEILHAEITPPFSF